MLKQLKLIDLIPFLDDNQDVEITAYKVPLYEGPVRTIPAIYTIYEITEKMYTRDEYLVIQLDC